MTRIILIIIGILVAIFAIRWIFKQVKGSGDQPDAYLREQNLQRQQPDQLPSIAVNNNSGVKSCGS